MPTANGTISASSKTDRFQGHDYYNVDDLLSDEHLLAQPLPLVLRAYT